MENFAHIKRLLAEKSIDTVGAIRLCDCRIVRKHKLEQAGLDLSSPLFVYIFAIPYYTDCGDIRNISRYAVARDYHFYFKTLANEILGSLSASCPAYKFAAFADDSPIDERDAAARAGLGIIGKNGLLITEKYSSYIFLGEIITDMPTSALTIRAIKECIGCGKCLTACPRTEISECLSAITQKKGALTEKEIYAIESYGTAWGCDICQEVCPHTRTAIANGTIYTNIDFFKENLTPYLDRKLLLNMSDSDFAERAYSWRKKETILRNLDILNK